MALKSNFSNSVGLSCNDAYVRVERVNAEKSAMAFEVFVYKDPSVYQAFHHQVFTCPFNLDESNPFIQAYEHLKTLPEFAGAQDC